MVSFILKGPPQQHVRIDEHTNLAANAVDAVAANGFI
jgi:hypothetical protein